MLNSLTAGCFNEKREGSSKTPQMCNPIGETLLQHP
jgi:hypothetical protein